MADDLSLLLKIKGDASGLQRAAGDSRAAIQSLRQGMGTDLSALAGLFVETQGAAAGMGTSIAAIAGPAGIALAAIGAFAGGVIKLHEELFSLAESAAGFRGKLFDLSQQTGVSVETLNALEIGLSKIGGSIDSAAQSLIFFQDQLGEAQDAGSKAGKTFADLGISTNDTEQALRDAFKALAEMPEGFRQTNLAAELFGQRGGKQFLALLKETNGDIDSAVDKLGELARVTKEDAQAADDFLDALRDLNIVFRGAFGKEAIPAATDAIKDLSRFLKENERNIQTVNHAIGTLATALGTTLRITLAEIAGLIEAVNRPYQLWAETLERIVRGLERIGVLTPARTTAASLGVTGGENVTQFGADRVGGGELLGGEHRALTEREIENQREAERARKKAESEEQQLLKQRIELVLKLREAQTETLAKLKGIDTTTHSYAVSLAILNGILKDATPAEQEQARRIANKADNLERQLKIQNEVNDLLKKQDEQVRTALEGEKSQLTLTIEQIAAWEKQGAVLKWVTKDQLLMQAQILATIESLKQLNQFLEDNPLLAEGGGLNLSGDTIEAMAGAAANNLLGPPPPEVFDAWKAAFAELKELGLDAVGSLAQGVGNLTQQWVLYGTIGPNAVRKMVASVLAGLAAQAAVQAIMELAYGLAALTPWGAAIYGPAPFHFQSAALFGSVAAGAAIAGRLVAGNSFSQGAAGSAGGGGGRSGSGQAASSAIAPQEFDRRNFIRGDATLTLRVPHGWLGDELRKDIDLNGFSRLAIKEYSS